MLLEAAYRHGLFPMADEGEIQWFQPQWRGVLHPSELLLSRTDRRVLKRADHTIVWNDDVRAVMRDCNAGRSGQWINDEMIDTFAQWPRVRALGLWRDDVRIGGIYGVHFGGIFMAESMFSRESNASTLALVILIAGLARSGVELIDAQWSNTHTKRFGVHDISAKSYARELARLADKNVELKADYFAWDAAASFVQSLSQTS